MVDLETIGVFVGLIATIVGVIGYFTKHESRHTAAETNLGNISSRVGEAETKIQNLAKFESRHTAAEAKLEGINSRIAEAETTIRNLAMFADPAMRTAFVQLLRKGDTPAPGNPYTESEKQELLTKYEHGNLSLREAQRLQEILQDVAMKSSSSGDIVAVIAIMAILIGLAVIITALLAPQS